MDTIIHTHTCAHTCIHTHTPEGLQVSLLPTVLLRQISWGSQPVWLDTSHRKTALPSASAASESEDGFSAPFPCLLCQSPNLGFNTALVPQYLTFNEVIFFAYVPHNEPVLNKHKKKFRNIHMGKVISLRYLLTFLLFVDLGQGFVGSRW